jgi:hypothetical protein
MPSTEFESSMAATKWPQNYALTARPLGSAYNTGYNNHTAIMPILFSRNIHQVCQLVALGYML